MIGATAMNVKRHAEVLLRHGRAFEMPPGRPSPHGDDQAARLAWRLEREVERVALAFVHVNAGTALQVVDIATGKLAVLGEGTYRGTSSPSTS